jgi:hypothetical protein
MGRRKKKYSPNQVYDPRYHPYEVIELMKDGKSITQVCAAFEITRTTFYEWKSKHPEFEKAAELAVVKSQAWWEEKLKEGAIGEIKHFDAKATSFAMSARFDDYKESPKQQGNSVVINIDSLSDDELNNKILDMAKSLGLLDALNQGITIESKPLSVEYSGVNEQHNGS